MPVVDGRKFKYTPEGIEAASRARRRSMPETTRRPEFEQTTTHRRLPSTPNTPPAQAMPLPSATPTPPPDGRPQGSGMPTEALIKQLLSSMPGSEGNPRAVPRPELPLPGDPRGRPGAIGVARPGMGPNSQPMRPRRLPAGPEQDPRSLQMEHPTRRRGR